MMSARRRRGSSDDHDPLSGGLSSDLTLEEAAERGYQAPPLSGDAGKPLRIKDDGTMRFGRFTLTRVGFLPPENADELDWQQLGEMLFSLEGALQWLIGDYLLHETQWGDTDKVAEQFGREVVTLYDYKKVAKAIPFENRHEALTFGHHKVIMSLPEDEQHQWLLTAVNEGWSVAQLRNALRDQRQLESPDEGDDVRRTAYERIRKNIDKLTTRAFNGDHKARDKALKELDRLRQLLLDL